MLTIDLNKQCFYSSTKQSSIRALTSAAFCCKKKLFTKEIGDEYSVNAQEAHKLVETDQVYLIDVREPEVAAG